MEGEHKLHSHSFPSGNATRCTAVLCKRKGSHSHSRRQAIFSLPQCVQEGNNWDFHTTLLTKLQTEPTFLMLRVYCRVHHFSLAFKCKEITKPAGGDFGRVNVLGVLLVFATPCTAYFWEQAVVYLLNPFYIFERSEQLKTFLLSI